MIIYTDKLISKPLHLAIRAQGHWIKETSAGFESSDDDVVQAIIDSYDVLSHEKTLAIKKLAQYASDLIDKNIDPLAAKRQQVDALLSSAKNSNGKPLGTADIAKLDIFEASMIYPSKIFTQYDIDKALILAITLETDWTLIAELLVTAKINLDGLV